MFTVLYRWRIKSGFEEQFVQNWAFVTQYFKDHCGGLGSRLHKGDDGIWYGYAQWRSAEDCEKAFQCITEMKERTLMKESIEKSFQEVRLEIIEDMLEPGKK